MVPKIYGCLQQSLALNLILLHRCGPVSSTRSGLLIGPARMISLPISVFTDSEYSLKPSKSSTDLVNSEDYPPRYSRCHSYF